MLNGTRTATASLPQQVPAARLASLTGLRWLAAAVVFGSHSVVLLGGTAETVVRAAFDQGRLGVSFFFILSGFIVTWAWRPGDRGRDFIRRRFARIYPSYLVALLFAVGLHLIIGQGQSIKALAMNVVLLQSWVPDRYVYFSGNDVGWSLSAEAFFYIAFPLLLPLICRLSVRGRRVLQGGLMLAVVATGAWAAATMPGSFFSAGGSAVFFSYIFPPVRVLEFALGITMALDLREGRRLRLSWPLLLLLTLVAYLLAGPAPLGLDFAAVTVIPLALLIYAAAQRDLAGLPTIFADPRMVVLGEWSFCFYLLHRLVMQAALALTHPSGGVRGALLVLACLVVSLAAAWALHTYVEKPAERRLRGRSRRAAPVYMRDITARCDAEVQRDVTPSHARAEDVRAR